MAVSGDSIGGHVWVKSQVPAAALKAGTFAATVKRGANTIVVQLDDVTPKDVALRSREVTFLVE